MAAFILLFLGVTICQAGRIVPKTSTPIRLSYNNANAMSDYTFSFQIETECPPGSTLVIGFPSDDFSTSIPGDSLECTDQYGDLYSCTVSDNVVTVQIGELSNVPVDNTFAVTLKNIPNPSRVGGTGLFKLATFRGSNVLDYADYFGSVGIVEGCSAPSQISISCQTNCFVGKSNAEYSFAFKNSVEFDGSSDVVLGFPESLSLPYYVKCSSNKVPGLRCYKNSANQVTMTGFSTVYEDTTITVTFTDINNPFLSTRIGDFSFSITDPTNNNCIHRVYSIPGPFLSTYSLTSVSITPNINTIALSTADISNIYWLTISATTSFIVPEGGAIYISLPTLLSYVENTCYVESGLSSLSESSGVQCKLDARTITITKFEEIQPGTIQIKIAAKTPTSAGTTSQMWIQMYYDEDKTVLLGSGSSSAGITIANIPTFNKLDFTWTNTSGTGIQIVLRPTADTTVTDLSLFIQLPGYTLTGTLTATLDVGDASSAPTASVTTSTSGGNLVIEITGGGTGSLLSTQDSILIISPDSTGISSPSNSGIYYLQIWLEDSSNAITTYLIVPDEVYGPEFNSASIEPISLDIEKASLYVFTFEASNNIPSSQVNSDITQSSGRIDLEFPTVDSSGNLMWETDLGTGLSEGDVIGCKSKDGFTVLEGEDLVCKIYPAESEANGKYAVIRVMNFDSIASGGSVSLYVAGIKNPRSAVEGFISVVAQGVKQNYSQQISRSLVSAGTFYNDNDANLPLYNGGSPASYGGDDTNKVIFSDLTVSATATMRFSLNLDVALTGDNYLITKMPSGFTVPHSGLTCYRDYTEQVDCFTLPVAGWIIFPDFPNIARHLDFTISIQGLTNPIHVITLTDFNIVAITGFKESEYIMFPSFDSFTSGSIVASITPDSYNANKINTSYTWIFSLQHDLPEGGEIVLTFPEDNYIFTTSPTPECTIAGNLQRASASSPLTCTYDSNFVTITNFASSLAGDSIFVSILHVLNPPEPVTTGYFEIATYSPEGYLIDSNSQISPITITLRNPISSITILDFYAVPSNGDLVADYTLSFIPDGSVPQYSEITISFPSGEYNNIPVGDIQCNVSGGLATVQSCTAINSSQIVIVTDTIYQDSGIPINLILYDIKNFSPGLTSGSVSIYISYSGVIFQESSSIDDSTKFTTTEAPGSVEFKSLRFSPRTEAVPAEYVVEILPESDLNEDYMVVIEFSDSFPRYLGDGIRCYSDEIGGDDGETECYAVDRLLKVQVAKEFIATESNSVFITVQYIINPNMNTRIGTIKAYTMIGDSIQAMGSFTSSDIISSKSNILYFSELTTTSNNIQISSNILMTATSSLSYTSNLADRIYIDFPLDYDLSSSNSITCRSELTESSTDDCEVKSNRIVIEAMPEDSTQFQQFGISLNSIQNPDLIGGVRYPTLYIYSGTRNTIIAKTYSNLNKVPALGYDNTGIQIEMNYSKPWSVNRGTTLEDLLCTIELESPGEVSISTVPPNGVTVSPNPIVIHIGENYASFDISVAQNVKIGSYSLKWTIQGNWPEGYFATIPDSYFEVTGDQEAITLGDLKLVNLGGHSLPIPVSLSKPVNSSLTITIKSLSSLPTLLTISPTTLTFLPGQLQQTFRISLESDSQGYEGQLFISKSGTDSAAYTLSSSTLSFEVASQDNTIPEISSCIVYSLDQNSATFRAVVSEPVEILYSLGPKGTAEPSADELLNQASQTDIPVSPVYGRVFEYKQNAAGMYDYEWKVDSLIAESEYVIYTQAFDVGGNFAAKTLVLNFATQDRYRTAAFKVRFNEYPITTETQELYKQKIASILKLDNTLLDIRTDYTAGSYTDFENLTIEQPDVPIYTTNSGTRITSDIPYTDIEYLLFPNPSKDLGKTPISYASSLNNLSYLIKSAIPTFDESTRITTSEILGVLPEFLASPNLKGISGVDVSIQDISLKSTGFVYICVLNSLLSPVEPSPVQVVKGLDGNNMPCDISFRLDYTNTPLEASFVGDYGESYWVYFAATNTLQRYPDVSSEVKLVTLRVNGKFMSRDYEDSASWISLMLVLLLAVLI